MSDNWIEMPAFFFKISKSYSDITFFFKRKMFTRNGTVKEPAHGTGFHVTLTELKGLDKRGALKGEREWAYEYVKEHYPEYLIMIHRFETHFTQESRMYFSDAEIEERDINTFSVVTYGPTKKNSYTLKILKEIQTDKFIYPEFQLLTKELREEIFQAIKQKWPEDLI